MPIVLLVFMLFYSCQDSNGMLFRHLRYEHNMGQHQANCLSNGAYAIWMDKECKDARIIGK